MDGGVVVEKVKSMMQGYGFDAATETYVDMMEVGIIDPAKVTRSALQNSASVSGLILTTEVLIATKKENKGEDKQQWITE
jgi:chaperonin GroEL